MFFRSTVIAPGMRPVIACDIGERTSIDLADLARLHELVQLVDRDAIHAQLPDEELALPPLGDDLQQRTRRR